MHHSVIHKNIIIYNPYKYQLLTILLLTTIAFIVTGRPWFSIFLNVCSLIVYDAKVSVITPTFISRLYCKNKKKFRDKAHMHRDHI